MSLLVGGRLEEIPQPHKRKFDDRRRKRKVYVSFRTWNGIGKHFYWYMKEETNPIWNRDKRRWQECFDDHGVKGRNLCGHQPTLQAAEEEVRQTFKKEFSPKTHRMVNAFTHSSVWWHYRDGD